MKFIIIRYSSHAQISETLFISLLIVMFLSCGDTAYRTNIFTNTLIAVSTKSRQPLKLCTIPRTKCIYSSQKFLIPLGRVIIHADHSYKPFNLIHPLHRFHERYETRTIVSDYPFTVPCTTPSMKWAQHTRHKSICIVMYSCIIGRGKVNQTQ